ncbi:MAG: TIGR03619 family F420-dependent LLM class oxidoreductase, partial [Mycobacterium leprae]
MGHAGQPADRRPPGGGAGLWTFQRLLFPAAEDRRWAPQYRSVHDPLVVLAFLAGQTSRIRLGVAIVDMPFYAPIVLAKMATSLDVVSAGRLDLGLGIGWAPEEYEAAGAPFARRGARADDFLRCLIAIWTRDPASYAGEFHRLPPAHVEPRPVQRPHPPLLLGGSADAALRRAGRLADGWVSGSAADLSRIGESIAVVRDGARDAGRDASTLRFVVRGVVQVRPAGTAGRRALRGSLDEIRADLAALDQQGVTELFADLNFDPEIGS